MEKIKKTLNRLKDNKFFIVILTVILTLLILQLFGNLTQDGYGVKYWRSLQLSTADDWSRIDNCYTREASLLFAKKGCINSDDWFKIWQTCRVKEWGWEYP